MDNKNFKMDIIFEFKEVCCRYEEIYGKMLNIVSKEEFEKLILDLNKLFEFCVKYDIVEIIKYLYEYKNVSYNEKILNIVSSEDCSSDLGSMETIVPINDSMIYGKSKGTHAGHFNQSIAYLVNIRKYSKREFIKGIGGIYSLLPRYLLDNSLQIV